ncbi:MAG: alcohol dehydrogenase catalytic domain-containing protein [Candidatus Nitrosocosmicus sp.]|nr:alcohol dehydrogenase catalytic domain-containing protein [Candidatus Nitrosocosmicus sp.]MDN5867341.1 alcohol dehydrogenase catalytic domain-containing protein [Candidatus Nitrosocosmicus sp.]
MKAAFFYGPNKIKIKNINIDNASNDSLTLKVLSCSVCSYDVRTYRNGSFKVKPPIVLGHEICAETTNEFKGKNFKVKSQERVSIYPVIPCLHCWHCNQKKYNLCSNLKEIGSTVNGGYAEYISIPRTLFEIGGIVPVLDNVTNEEASLIEPLACCINGINQIKSIDFDSIVILGDGPIGLMQLMMLKRNFPSTQVMVVGKINHRLEMARKLGADKVYDVNNNSNFEPISNLFLELKDKQAPNLIIVSNNNANSLGVACKLANKNGKIIIFSGLNNPKGESQDIKEIPSIDANFIHYNQISVMGSFSSNPENLRMAMELVNSGEIKIKNLITNAFELYRLEDAIKNSESFQGLKSIINKF